MNTKKIKKILIISCVFPPEPVVSAQLSFDIAEKLSVDNEVTVLSPKPTRPFGFKFDKSENSYNFKQIIVDSYICPESKLLGRMKESYSFGKECEKYIKKNFKDIDIVYQNSWPLFSQYFVTKISKKYGIRLITHIQDVYPEALINKLPIAKSFFYRLILPIDKYVLKNCNTILCISENMKKQLVSSRNLNPDKLEVVTNWQNEENFINYKMQHQSEIKESLFTFMYLGNNGPLAGVEFLIESFVKSKIPNSQLIIAGSGSKTEDCKNTARQLEANNIVFLPVPEGKVPEVQSRADVFLLPVKKYGAYSSIPSKLPAYMFSQKPIIGSLDLDSSTAKAIYDADAGIVVEPENEDKLIEAMKEISNWSKEKLAEKGKNAYIYSIKFFSKTNNLKKIIDIINNN